jgi:hypothetical protein
MANLNLEVQLCPKPGHREAFLVKPQTQNTRKTRTIHKTESTRHFHFNIQHNKLKEIS